jgi:hypothetical protein
MDRSRIAAPFFFILVLVDDAKQSGRDRDARGVGGSPRSVAAHMGY